MRLDKKGNSSYDKLRIQVQKSVSKNKYRLRVINISVILHRQT